MQIGIGVPRHEARQWLVSLRDLLVADGHQVVFCLSETNALHSEYLLHALGKLEGRLYGARPSLSQPAEPMLTSAPCENVDLFIALGADAVSSKPVLRLFLSDRPGIEHAIPALLNQHIPFVELRGENSEVIISGLPAIEEPEVITPAQDYFFARLITFIRLAVSRREAHAPVHAIAHTRPGMTGGAISFGAQTFCKRLIRRLNGRRWSDEHWSIGIRARQESLPTGFLDPSVYHWIKDDGKRYYADPILFDHEGRCFLFLEEFPYANAKGIISFTELDADGRPLATPEMIIESPGHMSYPFLFRHDGQIYMMPENTADNRLPLYRAARFPDRWVFERNLLEDTRIHDATMFEQDGAYWLLGNTEENGGSSWDCLSLYRSETPLGPFTPHPGNPVLIDTRFSRSGGPIIEMGGQIIRPVQCCLGTYGRALRFMNLGRLDETGLEQKQIGILEPRPGSAIRGVHTYARSARFEAIDARGKIIQK